jgi:hypothetical protein
MQCGQSDLELDSLSLLEMGADVGRQMFHVYATRFLAQGMRAAHLRAIEA